MQKISHCSPQTICSRSLRRVNSRTTRLTPSEALPCAHATRKRHIVIPVCGSFPKVAHPWRALCAYGYQKRDKEQPQRHLWQCCRERHDFAVQAKILPLHMNNRFVGRLIGAIIWQITAGCGGARIALHQMSGWCMRSRWHSALYAVAICGWLYCWRIGQLLCTRS